MSTPSSPPEVSGIHHLKFPVSSLSTSLIWYQRVMGATHLSALDHINSDGHRYAVILKMPSFGNTALELRLDPVQAESQVGFNPITWAVDGLEDLEAWDKWLRGNQVRHSRVLKGVVGWVLCFEVSSGGDVGVEMS